MPDPSGWRAMAPVSDPAAHRPWPAPRHRLPWPSPPRLLPASPAAPSRLPTVGSGRSDSAPRYGGPPRPRPGHGRSATTVRALVTAFGATPPADRRRRRGRRQRLGCRPGGAGPGRPVRRASVGTSRGVPGVRRQPGRPPGHRRHRCRRRDPGRAQAADRRRVRQRRADRRGGRALRGGDRGRRLPAAALARFRRSVRLPGRPPPVGPWPGAARFVSRRSRGVPVLPGWRPTHRSLPGRHRRGSGRDGERPGDRRHQRYGRWGCPRPGNSHGVTPEPAPEASGLDVGV